jgi:hypothetical protein
VAARCTSTTSKSTSLTGMAERNIGGRWGMMDLLRGVWRHSGIDNRSNEDYADIYPQDCSAVER